LKKIANTGNASGGLKSVSELFSSKGGTELGAMVEAFAQSDNGRKLLSTVLGSETKKTPTTKNGVAHS
jgi:flotillin